MPANPVFIQTLVTGDTALTPPPVGGLAAAAVKWSYVEKTSNYMAVALDTIINCTSGTFTVSLPTAIGIQGREYIIKNSGVGVITVVPFGAELIDGLPTFTVMSGGSVNIDSTGAGWIIL